MTVFIKLVKMNLNYCWKWYNSIFIFKQFTYLKGLNSSGIRIDVKSRTFTFSKSLNKSNSLQTFIYTMQKKTFIWISICFYLNITSKCMNFLPCIFIWILFNPRNLFINCLVPLLPLKGSLFFLELNRWIVYAWHKICKPIFFFFILTTTIYF